MTKTIYVSLNSAEFDVLMTKASFAEMGMYLILKKMANFKTGAVGSFRQQKLNYEKLAKLMSRPIRNTAPAELFDRAQARNIVARLNTIGLVCEISSHDDALKMRLPLSPINSFNEEPPEEAPLDMERFDKLDQATAEKNLRSPAEAAFWENDPFAINTDKNHQYEQYRHNHHKINTESTDNTDLGEDTSPSAPSRIHPQRGSRETVGMSAKLTAKQIEAELRNAEGFRLLEHAVSKSIMRGWENLGVTQSELQSVIYQMKYQGGYDLVPGEVDKLLRQSIKREKAPKGRGSVSL